MTNPPVTSTPPPVSLWSPKTIAQILVVNFGLFFQSTCTVILLLFSVFIYPFSFKHYRKFISYAMNIWSQNLVALIEWFAPANIVMSFDSSCGNMNDIVTRDSATGSISKLTFPERIIVTANHQV